jgi:AcrR family transcriptional regulator
MSNRNSRATSHRPARPDDPRVRRHARTKARILREAWKLAARDGVAGVSLGELAKRVGLRQPSLYTYFKSKNDLYDELFADGSRRLWADVVERDYPEDPRAAVREFARAMVAFCAADVARYHLLFQRHVPSFEPTPRSYALAERFFEWARQLLAAAGVERDQDVDVVTALIAGLADQQVANDPGGQRWLDLTDQVIEMLLDRLEENGSFTR